MRLSPLHIDALKAVRDVGPEGLPRRFGTRGKRLHTRTLVDLVNGGFLVETQSPTPTLDGRPLRTFALTEAGQRALSKPVGDLWASVGTELNLNLVF